MVATGDKGIPYTYPTGNSEDYQKDDKLTSLCCNYLSFQVENPIRSAGFCRAIMQVYAYTCAVCELNIRALSGESVTDAAHIIPFSVSYNDDIQNGISLCKSHHWAFDIGLIKEAS